MAGEGGAGVGRRSEDDGVVGDGRDGIAMQLEGSSLERTPVAREDGAPALVPAIEEGEARRQDGGMERVEPRVPAAADLGPESRAPAVLSQLARSVGRVGGP